ncbi:interleukin-13 receptor subunit alpha-1 [Plectropomus leopardus]|uniref:interleukin-13 receptor subunit alpha-1 n=1 Tax=Plectropomus leopardus TaxID=160734 RepID=UPI001C4AA204|nr:interleukin-13 receptor subunit alpha-1 [Plectropomus leopardus]XP_042368011.1 interleukin-13 receptor subunit alpha-1 [Plectropomus leopardus]
MNFTREFCVFLTCTAMIMVHCCKADDPPPPTGLSYQWLDPFTVNVSWQKPDGVPEGEVLYKYYLMKNAEVNSPVCTIWTNFTDSLLTEETGSDSWTYQIWTVRSCDNSKKSSPASISIRAHKPRAELKDFKCVITSHHMNCSWSPGNQPFNLSYRMCGRSEEQMKNLTVCDQPHSSGTRSGCYLKFDAVSNDVCMCVDTRAGRSTLKPKLVIHSPKLSVREEEDYLTLSWTYPEFGERWCWRYEVCHRQCNKPVECKNFTSEEESLKMAYDRRCRYEFRSRVTTADYCKDVSSDFGDVESYGTNEPPDQTMTVVSIVIPIILSVCIILSCYCFRRYSSILCPIIPDPSAIFKEMMMNGNKELKPPGSLYTPVPEPVESCNITVPENSVLQ